jgi:hypothetical protein
MTAEIIAIKIYTERYKERTTNRKNTPQSHFNIKIDLNLKERQEPF